MLTLKSFTGGFAQTNGWLVEKSSRSIAIDAPEGFSAWLKAQSVRLEALLLTHQHFDHVLDAAAIALEHQCPVIAFAPYSRDLTLETLFGAIPGTSFSLPPFEVTQIVADAECLRLLDLDCCVIHAPGHSPDSVAYHFPAASCLFGGDVLFRDGVGRTDLPGGSWAQLIDAISTKILTLPGETRVHPGHGPSTTLEKERQSNPFLND